VKKKVFAALLVFTLAIVIGGCSEASRVSENLSKEADNFNDVRQVTVINCIQGDDLVDSNGGTDEEFFDEIKEEAKDIQIEERNEIN